MLAVAARPLELHKSAPSLQPASGARQPVCYLPASSDKRRKIRSAAVQPGRPIWLRTHGTLCWLHRGVLQSGEQLYFHVLIGGMLQGGNGIRGLRVSRYSSSFNLVLKEKASFLLPRPDFQVSDNVYVTLSDGSSTCIMEQRL